jgi:uncharacterized protein YjbI with pentapeptide repeats
MEIIEKNNWIAFPPNEVDAARDRILKHNQAKTQYTRPEIQRAYKKVFNDKFPPIRVKNGLYKECDFDGTKLYDVAFNGATFDTTTFKNVSVRHTTMQSCDFLESTFVKSKFEGSNIGQSFFWQSQFMSTDLDGNNFLQSTFSNCSFVSCEIVHSSFESCMFDRVKFSNMRLADLNMEYAEFYDVSSDKVVFPFAQLPYIFGGLKYILETKDDVGVSSRKDNTGKISIDEYREILNDLRVYYWSVDEYFALANVCMALGKYDEARESINHGLKNSIRIHNYRMIKFYCKQAASSFLYSSRELREMYRHLEKSVDPTELNESQYYNYTLHLPYARNALLDNSEAHTTLRLTLFTNVSSTDSVKLTELLRILDNMSDTIPGNEFNKHIEIRHNSDFIIDLIASGPFTAISAILSFFDSLSSIAVNIATLIDRARKKTNNEKRELYEKIQELETQLEELKCAINEQKKKFDDCEKEKKQLESDLKCLEIKNEVLESMLSKKEEIENARKAIQENDIKIIYAIPVLVGPNKTVLDRSVYNDFYLLSGH